jgi:hypothetical protein
VVGDSNGPTSSSGNLRELSREEKIARLEGLTPAQRRDMVKYGLMVELHHWLTPEERASLEKFERQRALTPGDGRGTSDWPGWLTYLAPMEPYEEIGEEEE